ncbi:MAG: hypothetical protein R3C01_09540 [Planctomycetaceae bacterium]
MNFSYLLFVFSVVCDARFRSGDVASRRADCGSEDPVVGGAVSSWGWDDGRSERVDYGPSAGETQWDRDGDCPGGGYGGLVVGVEGHGIAKWLTQHNITGVVLEYRLSRRGVMLCHCWIPNAPYALCVSCEGLT